MQWWNDIVAWFNSTIGWRIFSTAILPFIAIIVAAVVAALIARGFARRVIELQNREIKAAAIMALIGAGRRAAVWNTLGADEKQHVDSLISEADLRMRLLPMSGAIAAADWAAHELTGMKKNSANFSFQAEQTFFDYRDRLLDWQAKPNKAKKLFAFDLVQWQYDDDAAAQSTVVAEQQEWAQEHVQPSTLSTPVQTAAAEAPKAVESTPPAPVLGDTAVLPAPAADATPVVPATTPVPASTGPSPIVDATPAEDADEQNADIVDDNDADTPTPIHAGSVRQRTAPDRSL